MPILSRIPVNDIVNGVWNFTAAKYNTAIDLNAAYRPVPNTGNFFVNFEIYDAEHAPLGIGGHPSGLVTDGINAALYSRKSRGFRTTSSVPTASRLSWSSRTPPKRRRPDRR